MLEGKKALVTGAATGIGRAIALALARAGAAVAVTDREPNQAGRVAAECGLPAFGTFLDVTDEGSTTAAFQEAVGRLGPLDIVVANAGVSTMNKFQDLTVEEWDFNMGVNARGAFLTNREAVRHFLRDRTKGVIVNTASMAGRVGAPLLVHYSASKFAVVGLTQALAREVAPHGIRVNCVCPGFVRTAMQQREVEWEATLRGMTAEAVRQDYVAQTPLGRLEEPEDVADVVVFLASDAARFITGQAIGVNGGALVAI